VKIFNVSILLSFQIFFSFKFYTKLSIFKAKTQERKVVLPPNKLKQLHKKNYSRAQMPTASCIECLVDLRYL